MGASEEELAALVAARARGEREGLFGPGSVTWTVLRETVLLLGGPRALLLQLAHPAIDAGIAQHSVIASDPLGRSARTFSSIYTLCFGDLASVLGVVRAVRRRHAVVAGVTTAGTPYRALDPALLHWVHATLLDTTVRMFETFVRPLTESERARFHDESRVVQIAFGVPPGDVLSTPGAFDAYFASVLASDALRVTPHAASQWEALVRQPPSHALVAALQLPPVRGLRTLIDVLPTRLLTPAALRLFAAGTLPPRVREAYGLRWTKADAAAFSLAVSAIRGVYGRLPAAIRFHPAYRAARARVRAPAPERLVG
jgi:uncharacterized protein (DUF2236 family)